MDLSYFLGKFRSEFVHADFGAVLRGDNNRVDSLWDAGTAIEGVLDCHLQRIAIDSGLSLADCPVDSPASSSQDAPSRECHFCVERGVWHWVDGRVAEWGASLRPSRRLHSRTWVPSTSSHLIQFLFSCSTWSPAPTSSSVLFTWTPAAISGDCCSKATSTLHVL